MKKLIAITLTAIMLMTVLPLNSFALFGKLPVVTDIKLTTEDPIYYSLIKSELESLYEYEQESGETLKEEDFQFDICYHLDDYTFDVQFKDGTSLTLTEDYYEADDYSMTIYALVDAREVIKAFENGETTVPLELYAELEGMYKQSESEVFSSEISIQESYFKEIRYISGLPEAIGEYDYWVDLAGCKFEVTYYDGSKEILEVEVDEYDDYLIDGKTLYFDIIVEEDDTDKGLIDFYCYDAECTAEINLIRYSFSGIYFLDIIRSEETGDIESFEYEIVMKDGSTKTFTVDNIEYITPEDIEEPPYAIVGQIDGYDIILTTATEVELVSPSIVYIVDEIRIGDTGVSDTTGIILEEESTNPIRAFLERIVNAFRRLLDFIRNLFA